ncbi:MAG: signal peptidase I [Polyangiaceae bacterium]
MSSRPPADSPAPSSPYAAPANAPAQGEPSLVVAFLLSFFASGAGQFYLGRTKAAVGWLALATIGSAAAALLFPALTDAGLFVVGGGLLFALMLVRPLSALETLRASKIASTRPTMVPVAVAFVVSFVLMLGTSLFVRVFLVEAFKIPAGSMMPTLLIGDHVFVDKKATTFQRGHLLVFKYPENPDQDFVKRVIGIGGDRIQIRERELFINDWAVPHCALGRGSLPQFQGEPATKGEVFLEFLDGEAYLTIRGDETSFVQNAGPWTVKSGQAFVLGDNRDNSHDSRYWFGGNGGGVPADHAKGEPFVVWLNVGDDGMDTSRTGLSTSVPSLPTTMSALAPALAKCLADRPSREKTIPPP